MDDGTEMVAGPGEITALPGGHDAWVVGEAAAAVVDWYGAKQLREGRLKSAAFRHTPSCRFCAQKQ